MSERIEILCAWCGVAFVVLFVIGWVLIAGWFQPPHPGLTATEITDVFQQHNLRIRIGMIFMQFVGAANIPFSAAIAIVMLRMKGVPAVLAYTQLGAAVCNSLEFIIPGQIFLATAFRPERAIEITQFGYDLGMIFLDNVAATAMLQFVAIALAIFSEQSSRLTFPRWFAFINLWGAVMFIPACLIVFFKLGPMTWSGILGWYLGALVYFGWFCIQFPLLLKAINEHYRSSYVD